MDAGEFNVSSNSDREWIELCSGKIYSGKLIFKNYYKNTKEKYIEIAFFILLLICLTLSAIWLYSWSVLVNDFADIDEFIYGELKVLLKWYYIILAYNIVISTYTVLVILTGLVLILYCRPLQMYLFHKIFLCVCFIVVTIQFCFFGSAWPRGEQWLSVSSSFEMTSPFLQLSALVLWVLFSIYAIICVNKIRSVYLQRALVFVYLLVFLFLLVLPFWVYSPCIGKRLNNLQKPYIIGHRGAPSLAPENTLLSFQKAIQNNIYALETDVRISSDGVPFLMHDDTLLRTTNVAELFPHQKHSRAESFTWQELSKLNAGEWYLDFDPFFNCRLFNSTYKAKIAAQKILSFQDFVSLASENNKSIIFDLFRPPYGHLNHSNYIIGIISTLLHSSLPQNNVIWPLSKLSQWEIYKHFAPGFHLMTYNVVDNATAYEIEIFNLPYSETTEETIFRNISVIEYVIDKSWTFSRAWCQGAWAITTNSCHYLSKLSEPSWLMTKYIYFAVWSIIDLSSIITVIFTWYFCRKKIQAKHVQEISRVFDEPLLN